MASVSLFWDTNMAAVTSCENTLYLVLSVFSLAKSMQLIFLEVSATYRLVIYLLSVTNLQVARVMHDFQEQCQSVLHAMLCLSIFSSKECIVKQLLDSNFVIFGIIKVSVRVISLVLRLGFVYCLLFCLPKIKQIK